MCSFVFFVYLLGRLFFLFWCWSAGSTSQGKHWSCWWRICWEKGATVWWYRNPQSGENVQLERSKRFTLGEISAAARNKEEERLHTSTRVDAVVMKRPHTREKRKREKRWISISYFLYTCDNPLMPNRCLLNVSGLISNSWWTGLGWTGVIGPSSSSVSYSSFALRQSSTFFSDLLKRATWATGRPASARQQSAECCRRSHASPPLLSITDVYKSHRYPFHSFILSPSFFMQL